MSNEPYQHLVTQVSAHIKLLDDPQFFALVDAELRRRAREVNWQVMQVGPSGASAGATRKVHCVRFVEGAKL